MATFSERITRKPSNSRSRASIACTSCRRRKIKCNVQSLKAGDRCTLCTSSGEDCVVKYDDNRKVNASKKYVRQLEERVESLESFLKTASSAGVSKESRGMCESAIRNLPTDTTILSLSSSQAVNPSSSISEKRAVFPEMPESPMDTITLENGHMTEEVSIPAQTSLFSYSSVDFERPSDIPSQYSLDHGIDLVNYDTTDNFHDLSGPSHWLNPAPTEDRQSIIEDFDDSHEFRVHHLEKLWKFQEKSVSMIDTSLFMAGYKKGIRSQYYSTFTLNAMLACALRLGKDEPTRALSKIFASRARGEIIENLENPNMSTVTALCFLSDYECTNGNQNVGGIYVGMACRLILDLGLHRDCSDLVNKGRMSKTEADARQRLAFGCCVYEQIWSMFLGRPSSMKTSYLHLPYLSTFRSDFKTQLLSAWFGLSSLIAKMVDLFSCPKLDHNRAIQELKDLDEAVHHWQYSLHPNLRWTDGGQVTWGPGVCELYMQFCNVEIIFHKTITANRERLLPGGLSEQDIRRIWPYTSEKSHSIMHDNAVKIAQALELSRLAYEEMGFATLMLDIIFTAASTLITSMTSSYGSQSTALKDQKWLMCLLEACESLHVHYPVVRYMITVLDSLLEKTGLSKFIWRGPNIAPPGTSTPTVSLTSNLDLTGTPSHLDEDSARTAPFQLKRWCEDKPCLEQSSSSLPSPPLIADQDDVNLDIISAADTVHQARSPTGDSLTGWNQMLGSDDHGNPMDFINHESI